MNTSTHGHGNRQPLRCNSGGARRPATGGVGLGALLTLAVVTLTEVASSGRVLGAGPGAASSSLPDTLSGSEPSRTSVEGKLKGLILDTNGHVVYYRLIFGVHVISLD